MTKKGLHNAGFNGQQCDEFDLHNYNPNQAHNGCPNLVYKTSYAAGPTSTDGGGPQPHYRGCLILLGKEVISIVQFVLPFGDYIKVEWESFLVEIGYKEKYKWQVTEKKQGTKNLLDKGVQVENLQCFVSFFFLRKFIIYIVMRTL